MENDKKTDSQGRPITGNGFIDTNPIHTITRNLQEWADPEVQARKSPTGSLLWERVGSIADVFVKAYSRGEFLVKAHYRRPKNNTDIDNYTTKGNINPYTGKQGTKPAKRFPQIAEEQAPAPPKEIEQVAVPPAVTPPIPPVLSAEENNQPELLPLPVQEDIEEEPITVPTMEEDNQQEPNEPPSITLPEESHDEPSDMDSTDPTPPSDLPDDRRD